MRAFNSQTVLSRPPPVFDFYGVVFLATPSSRQMEFLISFHFFCSSVAKSAAATFFPIALHVVILDSININSLAASSY